MSEVTGSCSYVFDPEDTKSGDGDRDDDTVVDAALLNDDGVWTCPHEVASDEDQCIFHRPVAEKSTEAVADALSAALDAADSDRMAQFVGAELPAVRFDPGTVVETHVRFDHASIAGGFLATDVAFERGLSARGASFGADATVDAGARGPYLPWWPPLTALIDDDHHGRIPTSDAGPGRHVSFCGADFGGDVRFDGAAFEGIQHVSFAHADFVGAGDVSFAGARFENRGHVAFNKADFENEGTVSFSGAVFDCLDASFSVIDFENDGDVSFERATFRDAGTVAFHDVDFTNHAAVSLSDLTLTDVHAFDFRGSTFVEDLEIGITADNVGAVSFAESDFSRATLDVGSVPALDLESADLTDADLSEVDLSGANLERAQLTSADLFGADLSGARIYGVRTGDTRINRATEFDSTDEDRCVYDPDSAYEYEPASDAEVGPIRKAMGAYHVLERLSRENTLPDRQSTFFARRQDMRRAQLRREGRRLDYWFAQAQNAVFRHGESFSRVVAWAVGTIVVFTFVFPLGGWVRDESVGALTYSGIADSPALLWRSFYHSALLFLTGRGPLTPTGFVGEVLTTTEAMIAPILLALLVFVLGRRAAR